MANVNNKSGIQPAVRDELNTLLGKVAATQAASTATDVAGLKTDFNALLTKLKAAGLMANS